MLETFQATELTSKPQGYTISHSKPNGIQCFHILSQYKPKKHSNLNLTNRSPYATQPTIESLDCTAHSNKQKPNLKIETSLRKPNSVASVDLDNGDCQTNTPLITQKENKPLQKLARTLEKLFLFSELEIKDLDLSLPQLNLLIQIVIKKFVHGTRDRVTKLKADGYRSELLKQINDLLYNHKSGKRVEENNKFIYKYTIKYLKKQFYTRNGLRSSKYSELLFYDHYFKSTASQLKIPLEDFYDPLYRTSIKNPSFKTVNNRYLSLIFSSIHFKADFFGFLKEDFKDTYLTLLPLKIKKLLKKLENDIKKSKSPSICTDDIVENFIDRIRRNHKCKLPWTYREVANALAQFASLVYYY